MQPCALQKIFLTEQGKKNQRVKDLPVRKKKRYKLVKNNNWKKKNNISSLMMN